MIKDGLSEARAKFGARTQREANYTARGIVARLIESYLDEGQPDVDGMEDNIPDKDVKRLTQALVNIRDRLYSR